MTDVSKPELNLDSGLAANGGAKTAYERLLDALNALPVGFCIWDRDERLLVCNDSYRTLFGRSAHIVQTGMTLSDLARAIYRDGQTDVGDMTEDEWVRHRLELHNRVSQSDEIDNIDGRCIRVTRVRMPNGDVVAARADVTDLRQVQAELAQQTRALQSATEVLAAQALRDPLTGLANRRAWNAGVGEILTKAEQAGCDVAVLCIDLDGFKQINDSFGHPAGDTILVEVGNRLDDCLPEDALLARVGGDEFLVAMPHCSGTDGLSGLCNVIIGFVGQPVWVDGNRCQFGVSVGATIGNKPGVDPAALMLEADAALYRSKLHGRNGHCLFDDELRAALIRKRRLASEIVGAVERGDIAPVYQPKVCATSGKLVGVEALARWRHDRYGLLPPDEFLGIATSLRLTAEIDRAILDRAIEERDCWPDGVVVSVNISAGRLREPGLLEDLARHKLAPDSLSLELVESAFLDSLDSQMQWNLDGLREMGIGIDLDDFGTGHASIAALLNIRPTRLKIDRSLVSQIDRDSEKERMVALIISMARSLRTKVVAEGVEHQSQAALLSAMGCDELQGYLYSRPLVAEELCKAFGLTGRTAKRHG